MSKYKPPARWTDAELAAAAEQLEREERQRRLSVTEHFSSTLEIHEGTVADCPECEEDE